VLFRSKNVDKRVETAVGLLKITDGEGCPEMSVPQAMRVAGFDEKECKDRTIQMRVRRAKNKLLVSKLHGSAVKEAAIAWKAEWEKKTRGELHVTARKVVSIINNKIEYKNNKPALRVRTSWC